MGAPESRKKIPISRLAHHYYLYDLSSISYLREHHNILGNFIGTLPQHSQQNIFLGLPLELLAEEARLLVERGVAIIVDDADIHDRHLRGLRKEDRDRYKKALDKYGRDLVKEEQKRRGNDKRDALARMAPEQRKRVLQKLHEKGEAPSDMAIGGDEEDEGSSLFAPASPASATPSTRDDSIAPKCITPTTSRQLLPLPSPPITPPNEPDPEPFTKSFSPFSIKKPARLNTTNLPSFNIHDEDEPLPPVPSIASYILFRHLHSKGYFQSPGLRFGCQYCVYPGDPLRFHSHFLARGYGWKQEIRLMDAVGGGRLGTGVKKSYLIGGPDEGGDLKAGRGRDGIGAAGRDVGLANDADAKKDVRVYCIEWAGM